MGPNQYFTFILGQSYFANIEWLDIGGFGCTIHLMKRPQTDQIGVFWVFLAILTVYPFRSPKFIGCLDVFVHSNYTVKTVKLLVVIGTLSSPRCPLRSHSLVCIENHLFIVGIGPILNKELEFTFRSDRSDRTCVNSEVSVLYEKSRYKNVTQSALFFAYKNLMQSVSIFVCKNITQSVCFFNIEMWRKVYYFLDIQMPPPLRQFQKSNEKLRNASVRVFVFKTVTQIFLHFVQCTAFCI